MPRAMADLTPEEIGFLTERHLGTLTTLRADGTPHVVAIAFTVDPGASLVRIITSQGTQKVRNLERKGMATVCQVDGRRWLTLEGSAVVTEDPERVAGAVAAFEERYRPARDNPRRVAVEITVERILGRA